MNLPEILNPSDIQTQQQNESSKQKNINVLIQHPQKQYQNNYRRRTQTSIGERIQTSENHSTTRNYFEQHYLTHLKTVGEDDIENKLSQELNKDITYQEFQKSKMKSNIQNNSFVNGITNEDKKLNGSQIEIQPININYNKFFKKRIRITSNTPCRTSTTNKSTKQNSQQSSPQSFQYKDIGSTNNFMLFSRKSTHKQEMSPENEQKQSITNKSIFTEINDISTVKAGDSFSKHDRSIFTKNQQKYDILNDSYTPNTNQKLSNDVGIQSPTTADISMQLFDRFQSSKIKKKFKGANGLTPQIIELWINDTLLEAQSEKYAQCKQNEFKQKPCTSLVSFGLDRKNLYSKGVSQDGIDRVFRSLFVYSFGFYEMLYEILEHLKDKDILILQIWRVYGILLEYCARGEFTTTINVYEKEKDEIVEGLNRIIAEKSNFIKEFENTVEGLKEKYKQDIHNFKKENEYLKNEINRLEEDNKFLDQQFNTEARMRLQFEHKINELYSIHRELSTKHQRLLIEKDTLDEIKKQLQEDLNIRNSEQQGYLVKVSQAVKELEEQILKNQILKDKNSSLEIMMYENKLKTEKVILQDKDLNDELIKKQLKINELMFQVENLKSQNKQFIESEKRVEEKKTYMQNEKEYYESKVKSLQQSFNEIQIKFNLKENEFSEIQYKLESNKIKLNEKQEESKQKDKRIIQLQNENKNIQIDLELCQNNIKNYQEDISNLERCVREYKIGQSDAEAQCIKTSKQLDQSLIQLESQTLEIKKQITQIDSLETKYESIQNEYKVFQECHTTQMLHLKNKLNNCEQDLVKSTTELNISLHQIKRLTQEKDAFQNKLFEMQKDFFELKDNNQEWTALEDKEKIIEELNTQNVQILDNFTDYKIKLEHTQRQLISVTNQYQAFQKATEYNIEQIHNKYARELNQYKCLEFKIHAMEYEDSLAQIVRQNDMIVKQRDKIKDQDYSLQSLQYQKEQIEDNRKATEKQKYELLQKNQKLQKQYDQSLLDIQHLKLMVESQKSTTIAQQENLNHHFTKELQETKQSYEEKIQTLTETLTKQISDLENQFKYAIQKNIALRDENDELLKNNSANEDQIQQQNQKSNISQSNKQQNAQKSRQTPILNQKDKSSQSPLKSPDFSCVSPDSPLKLAEQSIKSLILVDSCNPQINLEKSKQQKPVQEDKEIQTSQVELIIHNQPQQKEIKLIQLQNSINTKQNENQINIQKNENSQKLNDNQTQKIQVEQDKNLGIQNQVLGRKTEEKEEDLFQQQIQNRVQSTQQEQNNLNIFIHKRNVSSAYDQLKPSERYPTDKKTKKTQLSNSELAKIFKPNQQAYQTKK